MQVPILCVSDVLRRSGISTLVFAFAAMLLASVSEVQARASCPAASPNDSVSDDAALNACLAAGGTVDLSSGSPGYIVQTGLYIVGPVVLDGGPTGARLLAHAGLVGPILRAGYNYWGSPLTPAPQNFTIRRILFDGNRSSRSSSLCNPPADNRYGYNVMINGSGLVLDQVHSFQALCGTGMEVTGSSYQIRNSAFNNNRGDGLTAVTCTNSVIEDNAVWDNEDVGLAVGTGDGTCSVARNLVAQYTVAAHAGLLVGFHSGANVVNNTVYSNFNLMKVGLMVGGHIWNGGSNTFGAGNIQSNHIEGAVVLAAIDGISSGTFQNNTGANRQGTAYFSNCPSFIDVYSVNVAHIGTASVQPGYVNRNLDACFPPP
ncbi:right-handed parallel beta-helix repeat-containing protein [Luteitalea sp.]|uniref:right-handed parallel beta-helix repeat-containing protein n=1 Tax=Luteitalea sp. TaxID=2004800 RepID=UPI0025C54F3F|nr:right-handed parallel beta-helix repeat-containing protein [Luteitalea sp.]